jgi:hypothetical protein
VRFDQLDAVAEGVLDMTPVASFDGLVGGDFITGLHCFRDHGHEVINDKGRMRLPRRNEVFLHAPDGPANVRFPPRAASCGGFTFSLRPRMPR